MEITIDEIPRDPNLTTTVEDLDGIVGQPDDWTWLAVIDDQPGSYMRHPTRWVFTDFDGSIIIEMMNKNSLPKLHMDGQRVRLDDDMETDLGWTTSSSEGANGL